MNWFRWIYLAAVIAALGASTACDTRKKEGTPSKASSAKNSDPELMNITWKDYFHGADKSESQFLVRYTLNDIVSMIEYARTGKVPDKLGAYAVVERHKTSIRSRPVFRVTISRNGTNTRDNIALGDESIWSPDVYTKLLEPHWADARGTGVLPDRKSKLLPQLLEARMPDLARLDKTVSESLQANFRSPDRHTDAALLLLTLALNENNDRFADIRILMSRATAHLAFAKGLVPDYDSDTFRVATALRCALECNQVTALKLVKDPAFDAPAMIPWRHIVALRATRDYRDSVTNIPESFLERTEAFRARGGAATNIGGSHALDLDPLVEPRWMAILAANPDTVMVSRIVAANAWPTHEKEARDTYEAAGYNDPQRISLTDLLNQYPAAFFDNPTAPFGHVIGRGQWAQFFQRQLCQDTVSAYHCFDEFYGDPKQAARVREAVRNELKDIWLMAFARRMTTNDDKDYRSVSSETFEMARTHPELVSAYNWMLFTDLPPFTNKQFLPPNVPHPHANEWFIDSPVPGTSYEIAVRRNYPTFWKAAPDPLKRTEAAMLRAPYDATAIACYLNVKYPEKNVPVEEMRQLLGELPKYDSNGTFIALSAMVPENRVQFIKPLTALDPQAYVVLNSNYKDSLTPDEYAANAEALFPIPEHAVSASNMAPTVVEYYLAKSKDADAKRWADFGETVFSYRGLQGASLYYEKKGDYNKSIERLQKIEKRYNDSNPLIGALERFKTKYNYSGGDALLKKYNDNLFPKGKKNVTIADFTKPPSEGVVMTGKSPILKKYGFAPGVIVVACNGIQVNNFEQYQYARDINSPSPFHVIVYQADRYRELDVDPPNRLFGVEMIAYEK